MNSVRVSIIIQVMTIIIVEMTMTSTVEEEQEAEAPAVPVVVKKLLLVARSLPPRVVDEVGLHHQDIDVVVHHHHKNGRVEVVEEKMLMEVVTPLPRRIDVVGQHHHKNRHEEKLDVAEGGLLTITTRRREEEEAAVTKAVVDDEVNHQRKLEKVETAGGGAQVLPRIVKATGGEVVTNQDRPLHPSNVAVSSWKIALRLEVVDNEAAVATKIQRKEEVVVIVNNVTVSVTAVAIQEQNLKLKMIQVLLKSYLLIQHQDVHLQDHQDQMMMVHKVVYRHYLLY